MAAHGISRGYGGIKIKEPRSGERTRRVLLSPHPGLDDFHARFPQLTLWAIFLRCSAAISAIFMRPRGGIRNSAELSKISAQRLGKCRGNKNFYVALGNRRAEDNFLFLTLLDRDGFLRLVIDPHIGHLQRHLRPRTARKRPAPTEGANSNKHTAFVAANFNFPAPKQTEGREKAQNNCSEQKRQAEKRLAQAEMPFHDLRTVNTRHRASAPKHREAHEKYSRGRDALINYFRRAFKIRFHANTFWRRRQINAFQFRRAIDGGERPGLSASAAQGQVCGDIHVFQWDSVTATGTNGVRPLHWRSSEHAL